MFTKAYSSPLFITLPILIAILLGAVGTRIVFGRIPLGTPPTTIPAWQQTIADCVTGDHFVEEQYNNEPDPGCDDWSQDLYERPFNNSDHNHYYADQDLVQIKTTDDDDWWYFWIELYGTYDDELDEMYGIEADIDGDGCTDWFWTSDSPTQNLREKVGYDRWNWEGVIAYYDSDTTANPDDNVGGATCFVPDAGWSGDGFETMVDDQNQSGSDYYQDGLWAMSPSGVDDKVLILAVAKDMVAERNGNVVPETIWYRGWAESGLQDNANYHHHDKYTNSEAGDAYQSWPNYPTQNVYEDDTTAGINLHQYPCSGDCNGEIGDLVWYDENGNGLREGNESGIEGVTILLRDASDLSVLAITTTNSAGWYLFPGLEAGSYIVDVDQNVLINPTSNPILGKSLSLTTNNEPMTVELGPGERYLDADFGYDDLPDTLGAIGDWVWYDADFQGDQDLGEVEICDITIIITNAVGESQSTSTDGFGNYLFDHLPAGAYTVTVDVRDKDVPITGSGFAGCASLLKGDPSNSTRGMALRGMGDLFDFTTVSQMMHVLGEGEIFLDADFGAAADMDPTAVSLLDFETKTWRHWPLLFTVSVLSVLTVAVAAQPRRQQQYLSYS